MAGEELLANPAMMGWYSAFLVVFLIMGFLFLLVFIGIYVYSAFAMMSIARKTKTPNAWLAWIPVGNMILMANVAKMSWWPVLLVVPAAFFAFLSMIWWPWVIMEYAALLIMMVYMVHWQWRMYEYVGRPGWWVLIGMIASFAGLILMAMPKPGAAIMGFFFALLGALIALLLLGVAAWSTAPVNAVQNVTPHITEHPQPPLAVERVEEKAKPIAKSVVARIAAKPMKAKRLPKKAKKKR